MYPLDTPAEGENKSQWTSPLNRKPTEGTGVANINRVNTTKGDDDSDTYTYMDMHEAAVVRKSAKMPIWEKYFPKILSQSDQ